MESMNPTCIIGSWSSFSLFMRSWIQNKISYVTIKITIWNDHCIISLTMGVIFSSCLSISPCWKNSLVTRLATRSSTSHGLLMAAKSHTVIVIARSNERLSSVTQISGSLTSSLVAKFRNSPRFLKFQFRFIN